MQVTVMLKMTVKDEQGNDLPEKRRLEVQDKTLCAIEDRLFGEGFLPADVQVETWGAETL